MSNCRRTLGLMVVAVAALVGCDKKGSTPAAAGSPTPTGSPSSGGATVVPTNPLAKKPGANAPAAKPVAAPEWTPIPGGKEHRFAGVVADVPGTWNIVPQGNSTLIVPPGANQTSIEELYGFMGDPTLKTIDAPELEYYLDNAVMQLLQVPAQRAGPAEVVKVGALTGKMWKWTATLMDGRNVEVRSWGFVGSYSASLVAIATPEAMKRRMPELDAIRNSIRKPATAAIDASRLVNTWVRAFGGGSVLIGNANEQRIMFDATGRFHYHSEGTSHGLFHTSSSQTDVYGSWRLNGDQLSGVTDTGESATFTLEARTEAQTGAAVIAIDGTEFRQVDGRPWP